MPTSTIANQLAERFRGFLPVVVDVETGGFADRLKLARAVEDALTGIAYKDDAQTITGGVSKWYCQPGTQPRVEITIEELQ